MAKTGWKVPSATSSQWFSLEYLETVSSHIMDKPFRDTQLEKWNLNNPTVRFRAEMKMFQLSSGRAKTLFSTPPFFSGFCSGATAKHLSRRSHEAQQYLAKSSLAHQRLAPWPRAQMPATLEWEKKKDKTKNLTRKLPSMLKKTCCSTG